MLVRFNKKLGLINPNMQSQYASYSENVDFSENSKFHKIWTLMNFSQIQSQVSSNIKVFIKFFYFNILVISHHFEYLDMKMSNILFMTIQSCL